MAEIEGELLRLTPVDLADPEHRVQITLTQNEPVVSAEVLIDSLKRIPWETPLG